MQKFGSGILQRAGMVLGIVIIGGSLLGGVALAADLGGGPADNPGPTVPLGNDSDATTTPRDDNAGHADDADADDADDAIEEDADDADDDRSTPTCRATTARGEHADRVEDCEDDATDD